MYEFIWRHLPGPTWFRVIEALALTVLVVLGLFEFVFPWANATFHQSGDATVRRRRTPTGPRAPREGAAGSRDGAGGRWDRCRGSHRQTGASPGTSGMTDSVILLVGRRLGWFIPSRRLRRFL